MPPLCALRAQTPTTHRAGGRCGEDARGPRTPRGEPEREFFVDNLLVRIHFIIVMIRWTGLAPGKFEFLFPDLQRYLEVHEVGFKPNGHQVE